MSELTPVVGAQYGAFYLAEPQDNQTALALTSTYAYTKRKELSNRFGLGEGIVGQCARERKPILVTDVPENYVEITSGLGKSSPRNIAVYPIFFEDQVRGVIELGSFHEFTSVQLAFLEQLMLSIGLAINLIGTSMRTEQLLQQLQGSNVELDKRRKELDERALQLESRKREVAQASASLEAKSQESQYKSQFLANMSHEIRTPLNSMMILAQMLAANEDKNLSDKQQDGRRRFTPPDGISWPSSTRFSISLRSKRSHRDPSRALPHAGVQEFAERVVPARWRCSGVSSSQSKSLQVLHSA
jgi:Signal transduction histidine kinase